MSKRTYKLNRKCPKCGCNVSDQSKTGYCGKHYPRDGKNNPMYGRSIKEFMTEKEFEEWKKRVGDGAKRNWQNENYRNKIISSITGQKRSDEFKQAQSKRTKQSYINNPNLRDLRSKLFSECWKDGRNHFHGKNSTNRSRGENELFEALQNSGQFESVERKTIKASNGKWYYPDVLVNNKYIIEFYGDYFHANPNIYKDETEINVKKNVSIKELRLHDKERKDALESEGYKFMVVWQSDWVKDKELVLETVKKFVNE